jgi:predicted RNA-binding Zn ribbon-like protein
VGGHPCLDFINTRLMVNHRLVDLLRTFADLVEWLARSGLVEPRQAEIVRQQWRGTPEAEQALGAARTLRDVLHAMVEQIAAAQDVTPAAVEAINRVLDLEQGRAFVAREGSRFIRRFEPAFPSPDHLLVPIAEAAADLLTGVDLSRIKKCESSECVLYFYDTSKNHTRRWCSMNQCGNRMKVARHYQRQHPS